MKSLDSGTLYIKSKNLEETDWHVSRLSIRCMVKGEQYYKTGSKESMVNPTNFLLVNQGQRYKTSFAGKEECEMLMVAFKPGFAEGIYESMTQKQEWLLDNCGNEAGLKLNFFEKTYPADEQIKQVFSKLYVLVHETDVAWKKQLNLDALYTQLIEHVIALNFSIFDTIKKGKQLKTSTKIELYKRLCVALDYMRVHFNATISLEKIAAVACLSVHHFKRLFLEYFGLSPHKYLMQLRLKKAQELLMGSEFTVREICHKVGFENDSSFIRLFNQNYSVTPRVYRNLK
jgi:AraC family transcriptional regulator